MDVQVFLYECFEKSQVWCSGSHGSSTFDYFRNLHADFHSGWASLLSCQQFSSPAFVHFLEDGHLTGMRWYLQVVLTFISCISKDVEHHFKYLLVISVTYLRTIFILLVHLLIGRLVPFVCSWGYSLCYLILSESSLPIPVSVSVFPEKSHGREQQMAVSIQSVSPSEE